MKISRALLLASLFFLLPACGDEPAPAGPDAAVEQGLDASTAEPADVGVVPGPDASSPAGEDAATPGPDAGAPDTGALDLTPPTVISTDPGDDAIDVPFEHPITVVFSEPVDLSRLSAADFELVEWWDGNAQGAPLSGTLDTSGNPTIVFVPDAPFEVADQYRFTVRAGIRDLAGNALASDYVIVFDAFPVSPEHTPKVAAALPAAGAVDVPTNTVVVLTFSEKMAQSSISSGTTVLLYPGTDSAAPVAMSREDGDPIFAFRPQQPLAANTLYTLQVKGGSLGAKNEHGTPMAQDFLATFTTGAGPDEGALQVVSVDPAEGATGVGQAPAVTVTFNKPVNPASLYLPYPGEPGTFALSRYADGSFAEKGALDFSANPAVTFTLAATSALELERLYHVKVTGGAGGVRPLAGAALAANHTSSFTTQGPDVADGTIADLRAADGLCAIKVRGVTMTYVRDQPSNGQGFFIQKEQAGPGIFVFTGDYSPLYKVFPDRADGYPNIDITVSRVGEYNGQKQVQAYSMTRNDGASVDFKFVRENLVQVIGDVPVGADHESEYVQIDGTLLNFRYGSGISNREFDLTWGTGRKLTLKVDQYGVMEPLALANGVKVRVTAPVQRDAKGYFVKPYWYTTEEAMTAADLDAPANYLLALDIVKLAP